MSERLLTQAERAHDFAIALDIGALQVIEKPTTLSHELQQAAARVVVLLVHLEVLGQVLDALAEQRNLNLGRTRVSLVRAELGDRRRLGLWSEGHVLPFEFLFERASIRTTVGWSTAGDQPFAGVFAPGPWLGAVPHRISG